MVHIQVRDCLFFSLLLSQGKLVLNQGSLPEDLDPEWQSWKGLPQSVSLTLYCPGEKVRLRGEVTLPVPQIKLD